MEYPFKPVHPGGILAAELEARDLSVEDFDQAAGVDPAELHAVLKGKGVVTPLLAEAVARSLGTSPKLWLKLQERFDMHPKHGGRRSNAGRKPTGKANKQVRISANPKDMEVITSWLKEQPNQGEAVAEALYRVARRTNKGG